MAVAKAPPALAKILVPSGTIPAKERLRIRYRPRKSLR